jgi:GT2 family glycosyltransferase
VAQPAAAGGGEDPPPLEGTTALTPGLVSAIVVNWNGRRFLDECLNALAAQDYQPIETIVVDNGSVDGSVDLLEHRPDIRLIRNPRNLGFAAATTDALQAAAGEYALLLNYDATLEPSYVATLVAALQRDPRLGSATGKLLRPPAAGRVRVVDSTGHVIFRNDWAANRGENEPDGPAHDVAGEVFGVCAAAGLYRRAMLDDVMVDGEVLDSTFFAYLEDVDLDWRAQLRGWRSWYEPAARATHYRGGSGSRVSVEIQRHIFKNRILMIIKNDRGASFVWRLPGILAFTAAKFTQGIVRSPAFAGAVWQTIRAMPQAWRRRRQIQARRTAPRQAMDRWLTPYPYLTKLRDARGDARRHWISQS